MRELVVLGAITCLASPSLAAPETAVSDSVHTGLPSGGIFTPNITAETRLTERGGAFGLHIVEPLLLDPHYTVLAEVYGYQGEEQFGMVGGGFILRAPVAKKSFFEVNGFVEGLRNEDGFSYPQLGAGIGYTQEWFTVRANGYLPLRGSVEQTSRTRHWTEKDRSLATKVEEVEWSNEERWERAPMRGFDAEVELHLPKPIGWFDPRLSVGYYYRQTDDRPELYSGIMLRGELHFGEHWTLEAEYRDDAGPIDQEWRLAIRYQHFFGKPTDRSGQVVSSQMLGPARRSPWPTVAEGRAWQSPREGERHSISESSSAGDCCNGSNEPLIFE